MLATFDDLRPYFDAQFITEAQFIVPLIDDAIETHVKPAFCEGFDTLITRIVANTLSPEEIVLVQKLRRATAKYVMAIFSRQAASRRGNVGHVIQAPAKTQQAVVSIFNDVHASYLGAGNAALMDAIQYGLANATALADYKFNDRATVNTTSGFFFPSCNTRHGCK